MISFLIKLLTFWIPSKKVRTKVQNTLWNLIPPQKNYVIFYDTFSSNGNGDSIRPIAEELRRRRPNFKFLFVSKEPKKIEMADEVLIEKSKRFKEMCHRAKFVVSPMVLPRYKQKGQVVINVWHGSPLKKIGLSRASSEPSNFEMFSDLDAFCCSSPVFHSIYTDAFLLKENQFLDSGLPRNDLLFSAQKEKIALNVRQKLGLPMHKKVLFYCPTWRRDDYKMPFPLELSKLKTLKKEWCVLIRSHVGKHQWIDENGHPLLLKEADFLYDVGSYPNITELYLITDVLLGDYSSSMFDYAITEKPQIFFAYDLENYTKEFGMYFPNYTEFVPGPVVKNTEALIKMLQNKSAYNEAYAEKRSAFKQKYCTFEDGSAAKKVVDFILSYDEAKHD